MRFADGKTGSSSFTEALVAAIVANLQFTVQNVHVRYESSARSPPPLRATPEGEQLSALSSSPAPQPQPTQQPLNNHVEFAAGITIHEFSAQTTDRFGTVKFVTPVFFDSFCDCEFADAFDGCRFAGHFG